MIVAHHDDLALLGEELTPEARARFEEYRWERIRVRAASAGETPGTGWRQQDTMAVIDCVIRTAGLCAPVLAVVIPVGMVVGAAALKTMQGITYVGGSLLEPSLRLSTAQAERMAGFLNERATSAELVKRVLFAAPREFAGARQAESLLVVRMSARNCEAEGEAALCLVAEAQAFLADGTELLPTQHVFVQRPLARLAAAESGQVERTLDQAMDLLAASVAAAYTASGPLANLWPEEEAPQPLPAQFGGPRSLTDAERSVFPRTSASNCFRDGC
ncbi:MAG TPA: hypothetical protein VJQ58_04785 [Burkholderiales bacterium]|nr:hypothetical protein [Burkholderiales bacterium]